MDEDIEYALRTALDKLEEWYPDYKDDPEIQTLLDIYYAYFD